MVCNNVRNTNIIASYDILIFIKKLHILTVSPASLYYNGSNIKLYTQLLAIQKGFTDLMNIYTSNSYYIDTWEAIKSFAKYTKVKQYKDKLVIYFRYPKRVCDIRGGEIFTLISNKCSKRMYTYYDDNPKYNTLHTEDIKPLSSASFVILRRLLYADTCINKSQLLELEKVRKTNEKVRAETLISKESIYTSIEFNQPKSL